MVNQLKAEGKSEPDLDRRRSHWDRRADVFDRDYAYAPIRTDVLDEIFRDLPVCRSALDAGTGSGRTLERLVANITPDADVVGTDLSESMLEQARARLSQSSRCNVCLLAADNADLPFRTGAFDLVMSTFTLHHVPPTQQLRVLKEFRRVLRSHGTLILADQVQADPPLDDEAMRHAIAATFYPHLPPAQAATRLSDFGEWPLRLAEIATLLRAAGFRSKFQQMAPIVAVVRAWPLVVGPLTE